MTLDEALEAVAAGERVQSSSIPRNAVLKHVPFESCPRCSGDCGSANPPMIYCPMEELRFYVVFEATGDCYAFQNSLEDQAADWHIVKGWASYG